MNIVVTLVISLVIMSLIMGALSIRLIAGKRTALRVGACGNVKDISEQQGCCCGDGDCG